ncbi:hypothetical protein GWI33_007370 [Rhynchophorus ferrugineus]|uniref:Uncharacterized protein n=1 Tax=Rhynchophorus ferrugineus TaxID=354439 RepID=A0A834MC86_RHYFE|nr:hypothetical protein GWI33_007370 [Rhynchophorus ferrugineus]
MRRKNGQFNRSTRQEFPCARGAVSGAYTGRYETVVTDEKKYQPTRYLVILTMRKRFHSFHAATGGLPDEIATRLALVSGPQTFTAYGKQLKALAVWISLAFGSLARVRRDDAKLRAVSYHPDLQNSCGFYASWVSTFRMAITRT